MTREDEIEIARRFTEWIEYTASLYLTEESDILSVVKSVLSEIDKAENKGHWIEVDNGYICSECDIIRAKGTTGKYNYCPNCGADMRGEQE